ncbi:hypothetical protein RUM43_000831 [Polyplax serrata]|uniref:Corticotropin-releasing factor domain-containing protein n=1 Tax=Polyplax serrata TaxID=468196 RepID=A0AAN8SDY9_POLSC
MKHLTAVFVLILASTNASKYFRPEYQLQQDPIHVYPNILPFTVEDDRFPSKLSQVDELTNKWESPTDPRMMFITDLESLENILQEEPEEFRMKRMKASLSIDNPLDVLRHQYYKALARRMKFKSIEKNREHLIKTGKRSLAKEPGYRLKADFPVKGSQKNFANDNGSEGNERYSVRGNEQNSAREDAAMTRKYKNRLDDISYQT